MKLAIAALFAASAMGQPVYDLVLKGGHVIDPKNGLSARRDVAIAERKIAAVEENIDPAKARKVVDASSLHVSPGLIDIHVHIFAGEGPAYTGQNSVFPDDHSFRSGVTTVVDAGSTGWRGFPDFKRRTIDRSKTRVLSLLNIVGKGMGGKVEQDTSDMDPKATAEAAMKNKEHVVGIKTAHYSGPDWTAVDRAVEAGKIANMPIMVDFGDFRPERPFQELVLKHLRPGDIYTHMFLARVPMLDDEGKLEPYLLEARKRGVIFDVGHGGGSFVFRQAVPAVQQGFLPDSISTDLHITSMNAGMKDMLNVMSKFLNMGMTLDDVILRSTWNPAKEIRREDLGHLSVGAPADVSVLRVSEGQFGFVDVNGARMRGDKLLLAELTVRDGRVVWDRNGITREDWTNLPKHYGPQGDDSWDATIGHREEGARGRRRR
ncbi:MAG: amidohydrolase/deacetylase family metallohydrolase [Bryobacteraceae bacterium]|nr:amidohydrolase/deacetylase family metallohydrolase [Bryobacteraceae bacterium]